MKTKRGFTLLRRPSDGEVRWQGFGGFRLARLRRQGFTLIELMIVIAIIAIIAAIAIPSLLSAMRSAGERNASASLKTMTTAQADFRSNDRDGNLLNDFWTGDIWALYALVPITGGSSTVSSGTTTSAEAIIRLLDPGVAGADGMSQTSEYYGVDVAASIVIGSPKAGYIYRAFGSQDDGAGPAALQSDTDGPAFYGAVHDRTRFAFIAFPETIAAGKLLFLVNGDNTIYKYNLPAGYRATFTPLTPGADASSTITGSGMSGPTADFDLGTPGSGIFPQSPKAHGCSTTDN